MCARVQISAYMHAVLVHTAGPAERRGKVEFHPNPILAVTLTLFQPGGRLRPPHYYWPPPQIFGQFSEVINFFPTWKKNPIT